ncbi:MAG: hypothetical protein PW735_08260 [Acidobacteriaceae bacterium]|nr:hypothetical protein [Acidobacteriaceae bacterium]
MASYIASLVRTRYYDPNPDLYRALVARLADCMRQNRISYRAMHNEDFLISRETMRLSNEAFSSVQSFSEEIGIPIDLKIVNLALSSASIDQQKKSPV